MLGAERFEEFAGVTDALTRCTVKGDVFGLPGFSGGCRASKRFPRRRNINHGTGMWQAGPEVEIFFP